MSQLKKILEEWQTRSLHKIVKDLIHKLWQFDPDPDPWPEELGVMVRKKDAIPVCRHCRTV